MTKTILNDCSILIIVKTFNDPDCNSATSPAFQQANIRGPEHSCLLLFWFWKTLSAGGYQANQCDQSEEVILTECPLSGNERERLDATKRIKCSKLGF